MNGQPFLFYGLSIFGVYFIELTSTMNAAELENLIGYRFADPSLLQRALTHRSWAFENASGSDEELRRVENESLEFLGDSVLGLVIAEELFRIHPDSSEGELTVMKHRLVSTATLSRLANDLELGKFLRMGRGEEKTGGRRKNAIAADTLEAILGAVFLDGGYSSARAVVTKVFAKELMDATPGTSLDYKTLLQETLQARKMTAPLYKMMRSEGPPHDRTFYVEAVWATGKADGSGPAIKAAEMDAACKALKMLEASEPAAAI